MQENCRLICNLIHNKAGVDEIIFPVILPFLVRIALRDRVQEIHPGSPILLRHMLVLFAFRPT